MTTKSKPKKDSEGLKDEGRLIPPENGATVRMYRIGHGDCFLLAFAGETKDKPVYVLIDCGYKPGSPGYILPAREKRVAEIAKNIHEATGGHIDVAVITHEHQDHVNGITKANFGEIEIGETWLAWTEDPDDDIANGLRAKFKDTLLELVAARNRLAVEGGSEPLQRIDQLLELELGMDSEAGSLPTAGKLFAADNSQSSNKKSMKLFKDRSKKTKYIRPHGKIDKIEGAKDLRIFALGPPRDAEKIKDLDPQGKESFISEDHKIALSPRDYFLAAVDSVRLPNRLPKNLPFSRQYWIPLDKTVSAETPREFIEFFINHYGISFDKVTSQDVHPEFAEFIKDQYMESLKDSIEQRGGASRNPETPDNAEWRQIDREWLYSAEQFALDMNSYTNNSSLVLAFELGRGGKVLLFAADAQRGNWVSWSDKEWKEKGDGEGSRTVTIRDLLARTVLYKVGHHGSHNATLNGDAQSPHPSLGWMAQGTSANEFTAMITAVRAWAETQDGWDHPLKSIKDALLKKASGRVFQTDTDLEPDPKAKKDKKPKTMKDGLTDEEWAKFKPRVKNDPLYFDYTITR